MKTTTFIIIDDGRARVSKMKGGQFMPALNWEALEEVAKQEHDRAGGRFASHAVIDASEELAACATWDEVFIDYFGNSAMVARLENGFLIPAMNAFELADEAMREIRHLEARYPGFYPISPELAARAVW